MFLNVWESVLIHQVLQYLLHPIKLYFYILDSSVDIYGLGLRENFAYHYKGKEVREGTVAYNLDGLAHMCICYDLGAAYIRALLRCW